MKPFDRFLTQPGFNSLSRVAQQALSQQLEYREFQKGDFLLRAGEPATQILWLLSGACREYFVTRNGEEYNKAFVLAGGVTGSLYDLRQAEPSSVYIECLQPTTGFTLAFEQFIKLTKKHADLGALYYRTVETLFMKKCRREHEFLTMNAATRYQSLLRENPAIEKSIPQYHIASYLGITPEALSRIRRKTPR